jgi:hypothetical protein
MPHKVPKRAERVYDEDSDQDAEIDPTKRTCCLEYPYPLSLSFPAGNQLRRPAAETKDFEGSSAEENDGRRDTDQGTDVEDEGPEAQPGLLRNTMREEASSAQDLSCVLMFVSVADLVAGSS